MNNSSKDYREIANRYSEQAAVIDDENLRQVMLQTAGLWMEAAVHLEKSVPVMWNVESR
jgi:hypothetical protein